jgi:hypothetical protein
MALSNWDTLAIDHKGQPCAGLFISPCGVNVHFYKNWLYIHHEPAWHAKSGFSSPCVGQIQHGDLSYLDVDIEAVRGPQQGVYAVVSCGFETDSSGERPFKAMVGCGVYGFDDETWVGVTQESRDFLQSYITRSERMTRDEAIEVMKSQRIYKMGGGQPEVKTNQYEEALKDGSLERWIDNYLEPDYEFNSTIRALDLSKATRFNQGDQFFANTVNKETPATAVGKAKRPVILNIIEKMK